MRAVGDRKLEGRILGRLGNICLWEGRHGEAHAHYAAALECFREVGSRLQEARMLGNLAIARHEQGRPAEALAHYEAALAIEREIGSQRDEAITLCNLADLLGGQGRDRARARDLRCRACAAARAGRPRHRGRHAAQLGTFELEQGLVDEALATLRRRRSR